MWGELANHKRSLTHRPKAGHPGILVFVCLYVYKCKNIFNKMLKDVGMEVPESIETRSKFSMHAKAGDDSMQQS